MCNKAFAWSVIFSKFLQPFFVISDLPQLPSIHPLRRQRNLRGLRILHHVQHRHMRQLHIRGCRLSKSGDSQCWKNSIIEWEYFLSSAPFLVSALVWSWGQSTMLEMRLAAKGNAGILLPATGIHLTHQGAINTTWRLFHFQKLSCTTLSTIVVREFSQPLSSYIQADPKSCHEPSGRTWNQGPPTSDFSCGILRGI